MSLHKNETTKYILHDTNQNNKILLIFQTILWTKKFEMTMNWLVSLSDIKGKKK